MEVTKGMLRKASNRVRACSHDYLTKADLSTKEISEECKKLQFCQKCGAYYAVEEIDGGFESRMGGTGRKP